MDEKFVRVFLNDLSTELVCFKAVSAWKHLRFVPLSVAPCTVFSCVYREKSWCSRLTFLSSCTDTCLYFFICFSYFVFNVFSHDF